MKFYACLLYLLLNLYCGAQHKQYDIQKTYSIQQVLEDIDYTEKYLLKFHPDPYRYISEDSLRAFIKATRLKITKPLNEMQVRFFIKQIVAKIGCGHTDVASSKAYAKAIVKLNRPIMPLNTYLLDSKKLIVINNLSKDSLIKEGDEVSAIDGHPIDAVLKTIFSVYTTDGYNETCKKRGIKYEWFKYYYSFCYGFKPEYTVTFKNAKGKTMTSTLQAISSMKDTLILPKKDSLKYLHKTKTCRYSVMDYTKPIAVVDINGFSGRHWKRFFRRSFKDIRKKQITNLVIDLRDNGGGQINDGLTLMSYLIPKTIKIPFDRKPNLLPFNPRLKMGFGTRLTPLLFTFFLPQIIKKGRLRHYFFGFPKHRNAYKGNIYVLVNGKSFSMSCIAAAYLKYKANATIIGDETGGNVAGSNAIINGTLFLPHTRVKIFVPIYHIYHDINVENKGHGLLPDYKTVYSDQDILKAVDMDMKKVKELVN